MRKSTILAYALTGFPLAVVGLPLVIYVPPMYAAEHGLALATVGAVLMLARLADVVIDPAIGWLSDRFPTPFGRRRPWIVLGAVVTVIGVHQVYAPPPPVGGAYLLGWITLLYLGWSLITIPYGAWGAGLTTAYHTRSVITGTREFLAMLGILFTSVLPTLMPGKLTPPMAVLADIIAVLLPVCVLVLVVFVREPATGGAALPRNALRLVWRNAPFRLLLGATLLGGIGTAINNALVVLYLQQIDLDARKGPLLGLYLVGAVIGVPLWVALAARIGKHRALAFSTFWGCGFFACVPFVPPGLFAAMAVINTCAGMAIGAAPVLGASMAADVVDWDALRARRDRSALYFALWAMAQKLTQAVGIAIAFPALQLLGYDVHGANGPAARGALTVMYVGVPIAFWVASNALIWNFPLDRRRQARIAALRATRLG